MLRIGERVSHSRDKTRTSVRGPPTEVWYTPYMKTITGLIGYALLVAFLSLPSWFALRYSDIDFAFLSVMAIVMTLQMSVAFILAAQNSGKVKKYKEIDMI